jgi:hypothetical protein
MHKTIIIVTICNVIFLGSCTAQKINMNNSKWKDLNCGSIISWQVHFQEGFKNDTILMIFGRDTLMPIYDATSGGNSCTSIRLSVYKEGRKWYAFVNNLPKFTVIQELRKAHRRRVKFDLVVNGRRTPVNLPVKEHRFFGFSMNPEGRSFTLVTGEKCLGCL